MKQLKDEKCPEEVKKKAAALLIQALGDTPLQVCSAHKDDALKMLKDLDDRYASSRTSNRIAILTALYGKKFRANYDMTRYIDEFEALFS